MVDNTGTLVGGTVPVALLMYSGAKETGTLNLWGEHGAAKFLFSNGQLIYARLESGKRLGQALVEKGLITDADLQKVLHLQGRKKVKQGIGTILHTFGLVTREVAQREIEDQMLRVIRHVLGWAECRYRFEPLDTEIADLIPPGTADVEQLLERLENQSAEEADGD